MQAAQLWRGYAEAALADPGLDARAEQNCCYDDGGCVALTWSKGWLTSHCHASSAYVIASEPALVLEMPEKGVQQYYTVCFAEEKCCSRGGPAAKTSLVLTERMAHIEQTPHVLPEIYQSHLVRLCSAGLTYGLLLIAQLLLICTCPTCSSIFYLFGVHI